MKYFRAAAGLALLIVLNIAVSANADMVYGDSAMAELVGSRSAVAGTMTVNDTDWDDGLVSWNIVDNLNGSFSYSYTFSNFNKPGISHFTLDISDDAVSDPAAVTDATLNGGTIGQVEFGTIDGITGAVKFDSGDDGNITYAFNSNRSPVYGDFLLKGGSSTIGTNTAFGDQTQMATSAYIPRPNGVTAVPEPSAFLFLGVIAAAMTGLKQIKRRRKA